MAWPLKQKWFWMLFFILLVTLLGTFVIAELIFTLSPNSIVIALVVVLVLWVVFRSYRKWASDKSEEHAEAENDGSDGLTVKFVMERFY